MRTAVPTRRLGALALAAVVGAAAPAATSVASGRRATSAASAAPAPRSAPAAPSRAAPRSAAASATTPPPAAPFRWDLAQRLEEGPRLAPGVPVPNVIPRRDRGGYTAKVVESTPVLDAPGGRRRVWTAGSTTLHTGNATRLSVRRARFDADGRAWLGVQLPIRPNASLGWVPYDAVVLEHTTWFVSVRLQPRRIEILRAGRLVRSSSVVIGAPSTPTPTGDFAIYEIAQQPSARDFLGPWALHLTSFSDVLTDYGGGPGRVAVHGRGPASILDAPLGAAASHGCVRVPNALVSWMHARTLAGTPLRITDR
ncbi:L,D-transpeptidase [Patulibacter sp. NPDC049589]|uniref:L,D-transpeptidase n=1 Tax=Patulibacter sp. NPDC049589 TaxID=3154731 RepID=UPI003416BAAD